MKNKDRKLFVLFLSFMNSLTEDQKFSNGESDRAACFV